MKKYKNCLAMITSVFMLLILFSPNYLQAVEINKCNKEVITDKAELERISKQDNDTPDGYELVKVINETIDLLDVDDNLSSVFSHNNIDYETKPLAQGWYLTQPVYDTEIIFTNDPIVSDYIDGPANYTQTYSETVNAKFSFSTGVHSELLSSKFGFDTSYSKTLTRSYAIKAKKNEKVNVKVFVVYKQWHCEAYFNGNYKGIEYARKPQGLSFKQKIYKKK